MKIDYGLIMSAGLGTRMGPIGEILPKVLWPIVETTLLKLQVKRLQDLGCKKIFINSHFLHEQVEQYIKNELSKEIEIFFEPTLYGSGGTINEMVAQGKINQTGNLLYSAGDQFFFFNEEYLIEGLLKLKNMNSILFGLTVPKDSGYGELELNENKYLEHIIPSNNKTESFTTFSGLGLVNLERIKGVRGYSEFFRSVAPLGEENLVLTPDRQEYWDFGTAEKYFESTLRLKEDLKDKAHLAEFSRFFLENSKNHDFTDASQLELVLSNGEKFLIDFSDASRGFQYGGLAHRV